MDADAALAVVVEGPACDAECASDEACASLAAMEALVSFVLIFSAASFAAEPDAEANNFNSLNRAWA